MSLETNLQTEVSTYENYIQGCSGIMAQIVSEGLTGTELADCLQNDYNRQMTSMGIYSDLKSKAETKLERLQSGWTGEYATYVNEIESGYTGRYTRYLQKWLAEDSADQYQSFFTMYGQTTNDFQKKRLFKMTFGS